MKSKGKLIVLIAFVLEILIPHLYGVIVSELFANSTANYDLITTLGLIYTVIIGLLPAVLAIGFALMYRQSRDKHDVALALAAILIFLSSSITAFIKVPDTMYLIVNTAQSCIASILPLAWALKYRRRIPFMAIILALVGVWVAFNPILFSALSTLDKHYDLPGVLYSVFNVLGLTTAITYVAATLLEKNKQ